MRITGGSLKGRLLGSLRGKGVRPSTDRLRSAIFSILSDKVEGTYVLDLFSGTGSLGIEALSRGAKFAVFLDIETFNLKENLKQLSINENIKIFKGDFLSILKKISISFDIIFIDPPYGKYKPSLVLNSIKHLCHNDTMVVFEEAKNTVFDNIDNSFIEKDSRIYGDTQIKIYEVKE